MVGLSMGGEEAVGATADDTRIGAVVAEGVTGRVLADHGWLPKPAGWVNLAAESVMFTTADLLSSAERPIGLPTAVARAGTPTLLIAAGNLPDEQRAAAYFREASPEDVEVWVAPDSGHTGSLAANPAEWDSRVVSFLDRSLGVAG